MRKIEFVQLEGNEFSFEKSPSNGESTKVLKVAGRGKVVAIGLRWRQAGSSAAASAVALTAVSAVASAGISAAEAAWHEKGRGRSSIDEPPTLDPILETLQLMLTQAAQMLVSTQVYQVKTAHIHGSVVHFIGGFQIRIKVEEEVEHDRISRSASHVNYSVALGIGGVNVRTTGQQQLHVSYPLSGGRPV